MSETTTAPTAAGTWNIDEAHTQVEFSVKHMMIANIKGHFAKVSGTVVTQKGDFTDAVVDVTIDAASLDTREEQRDGHLRSADFFCTLEQYPSLRFVSKRVAKAGDGYRLVGDLTIRDVTREVTLAVTDEGRGKDPWRRARRSAPPPRWTARTTASPGTRRSRRAASWWETKSRSPSRPSW